MHILPVIVVRCARTSVHLICSIQKEEGVFVHPRLCVSLSSPFFLVPGRAGNGCGGRGAGELGERRTVDTTPTTEALPSIHDHRAVTERGARTAHVLAHRV